MLTKLTLRNFKRFESVEIELASRVVFVGPNNSGKTTALQALALWDMGLQAFVQKRGLKAPGTRPAVALNRRDFVALPVPDMELLWRGRKLTKDNKRIPLEVVVHGTSHGEEWTCGLQFEYRDEDSVYCRPLQAAIPEAAARTRVAFLPPMSGMASHETRIDEGAIRVRLGEGRTAEVLRNLCHLIATEGPQDGWIDIERQIESLFRARLSKPEYIASRGEIAMEYEEAGVRLDLSAAGRGLQQTLLLLAYLIRNHDTVLLLDEPDAHLEIVRQRQIYSALTDTASRYGCQIVAASHSEVLLNEAAERDLVIAFVGKPHPVNLGTSQVRKSLAEIGFEQYYQAEQKGWVLYLEGSTDLAIPREFARLLQHPAAEVLDAPFVHYVGNKPGLAAAHFFGLREAKPDFTGFALFDRLGRPAESSNDLDQHCWRRREIECYFMRTETLEAWALAQAGEQRLGPLFAGQWVEAMRESLAEIEAAFQVLGESLWSPGLKVSERGLPQVLDRFYRKVGLPSMVSKTGFWSIARFMDAAHLDGEVTQVLDRILAVAGRAVTISETPDSAAQ